jgi:hypothetical protein
LASVPPQSETFLREVDEELRRDEIASLWKRWGKLAVAGAIALLAAWGGWLWWQDREQKAAGLEGEQMAQALDQLQAGSDAQAQGKLKALAASERDGYRIAAQLTLAASMLQRGDNAGAAKGFAAIANDASIDQPWRDLALVRQTAAEYDGLTPATVIARLKPMAVKGHPWFGSAGEMVAVAYLNSGQRPLAGKLFAEIGKDEQVPESIRSRAVQMAGALGVDAVNPAGKEAN